MELKGQTAVITGAARGIGAAVAASLAEAGAYVVATDVLDRELERTRASLNSNGEAAVLDVTDAAAWETLAEQVEARRGGIDILVNNAGILKFATLEDTDPDAFRQLFDVNVMGSFLGLRAVIPAMKRAGRGVIVNVSSSSAILPNNGTGAYSASKFAIRGLTRAAALELGPYGIRVNSVHPGGVNTPMTNPQGLDQATNDARYSFVPLQRGSRPEEIAEGVRFLVSDRGSYCNGMELVIDGGLTAGQYFYGIPGAPDR